MDKKKLLIGAGVVAVGYLIYKKMSRPAPVAATSVIAAAPKKKKQSALERILGLGKKVKPEQIAQAGKIASSLLGENYFALTAQRGARTTMRFM